MPEADRFDHLFDDLTRDVTRSSSPGGAPNAIRAARRRRVGRGVAAVVAVAVVGTIGVGLATGGEDRAAIDPADTTPSPAAMPAPAALDAATFDAAASPWSSGWTDGDSRVLTDPPCEVSGGSVEPLELGSAELRHPGAQGVMRTYVLFASAAGARAAFDSIAGDLTQCAGRDAATTLFTDARVDTFRLPGEDRADPSDDATVQLVVAGERVGLLSVVGVAEPPPAATADRIATAVVAGLLDAADPPR